MSNSDVFRLASNIAAYDALNSLALINKRIAVSQKRLSSGKRLNSAADDPAGYSMAMKFDARRNGIQTAINSLGDSQNLMAIAESGTSKIMDLLIQMRAKTLQAASDTLGVEERAAISRQVNQYSLEIDDIVKNTSWNGNRLLDGFSQFGGQLQLLTGADGENVTINASAQNMGDLSVADGELYNLRPIVRNPNRPPVNRTPTIPVVAENGFGYIQGLGVTDPDAQYQPIKVTLKTQYGSLTLRTDVSNGLGASDIQNNVSSEVTLTGTMDAINRTLAASNAVKYSPDGLEITADTLTMITNDQGNAGQIPSTNETTDSWNITVSPTNDTPSAIAISHSVDENLRSAITNGMAASAAGFAVSEMLISSDPDGPGTGMAVTSLSGTGQWQYSIDNGTTWLDFQAVAANNSTLLGASDRLRFIPPNGDWYGQANIGFHAWDKLDGYTGGTTGIDTGAAGESAYASPVITGYITVNPVNDAPVVGNVGDFAFPVHTPPVPVSDLVSSAGFSAADGGIAVTGLDTGSGTWEYSINGGISWNSFGSVSDTGATLLANTDLVRFSADPGFLAPQTITYRSWDVSNGKTHGTTGVDVVNHYSLTAPASAVPAAPPPSTVASLLSSTGLNPLSGVAVTGLQTGSGTWEYSTNAGTSWNSFGAVSSSSATLLRNSDLVRFWASSGSVSPQAVTFRSWDGSTGSAGQTGVNANMPFSAASAAQAVPVNMPATTVASLLAATSFSQQAGIAVTGLESGAGTWEYSTNLGGTWSPLDPGVSDTGATLLASSDLARFSATPGFVTPQTITFHGWDGTNGLVGASNVNVTTPYSDSTAAPTVAVIPPATTVASLLSSASFNAAGGIAVTGLQTGLGTWEYSRNGGSTWASFGAISETSATLLANTDLVRFWANAGSTASQAITYRAWDLNNSLSAGATNIDVTPHYSANTAAPAIVVDPPPTSVASLLAAANVTDVDSGAFSGIAVTGLEAGSGTWQYSTNGGSSWLNFGAVSDTGATLLGITNLVRFSANKGFLTPMAVTFRAWDRTNGLAVGSTNINVSTNGAATPYSANVANAVRPVNALPVLDPTKVTTLDTIREDDKNNTGSLVSAFTGAAISDTDPGALSGIAVTGWDNTNGTWQFSTNGGVLWNTFSGSGATLLDASARVRFQPTADYSGNSGNLIFRAWDQTEGWLSGMSNITLDGSATSTASATTSLTITPLNESPVLGNLGAGLTSITEDPAVNVGDPVSSLLAGSLLTGVAITQVDNSNGSWEYSTNSGSSWNTILATSDSNATVLDASAQVRFVPNADFNGSADIRYRAWDPGNGLSVGSQANTSLNRGMGGAYSTHAETASVTVTPTNDAPSAGGMSVTTVQSLSVGGRLPGKDVDGNALSYQLVSGPSKGSLAFGAGGSFHYTPNTGAYGTDQFSYKVNDGTVDSAVATVTINILKPEREIQLLNSEDASAYLGTLDDAMAKVNQRLVTIGSIANHLQIKEDALMPSLINTEAAYNRLMNADFAREQMEMTKNLILQKTSIAMLAQAMKAGQYFLSLLQ